MARTPSIGAIPSQASAEMQQILIAMKRTIEILQQQVAADRARIAALESRVEELETT
jgi:hypothetical protein